MFDQALALNEDHVEALLWRGGLSEAGEALPFLERALALDPTNQRARDGLTWARRRVGLDDGLPAAAEPSTQRPPLVAPAWQGRAAAPVRPAPARPRVEQPAAPLFRRPIAAAPAPAVATPATAPMERPAAPGIDLFNVALRGVNYLVAHPTMALVIAVLLLGILGTAAVARAGLGRDKGDTGPVPQVLVNAGAETGAAAALPATVAGKPATSAGAITAPTATPVTAANAASLDKAWAASDWPLAILIIDEMLRRTPDDKALLDKKFKAHYNNGVQLVRSDRLSEAVAEFDKALLINGMDLNVLGERRFAQGYLDGTNALNKGDYAAAIASLKIIYEGNPNYRSVKSRLFQAYMAYADQLEKGGKRTDAYLNYKKASFIDTQSQEAKTAMARTVDAAPPEQLAAAASKKRIDVDLVKQRVTVYQNDKVVFQFKASTGASPYVTRTGNYEILNKIPNAYSSAMEWGMPYWMGIYQAGGSENGFHGMARLSNGTVLSTSVLGRPATRGCIMLSDEDAKKLYDWAEPGIPVTIH